MYYSDPLEEYLALTQGSVPYQTPAQRMQQGLPGLPTQQELAQGNQPVDTSAAHAALMPYMQDLNQSDWNSLGGAYGFEPGPMGPTGPEPQPEQQPGPVAPPPQAAAPPGMGGFERTSKALDQYGEAQKGVLQAGQQSAANVAGLHQDMGRQMEQQDLERQRQEEEFQSHLQQKSDDIDQAVKERTDYHGKIDPTRWWKNRSGFGKALTGLSVALGAAARGTAIYGQSQGMNMGDLPNHNVGLEMMEHAINQDIALQHEEIQSEKERLNLKVQGAQGSLSNALQRTGDMRQAKAIDRVAKWEQMQNALQGMAAESQSSEYKARAATVDAEIGMKKEEARQEYMQSAAAAFRANREAELRQRGMALNEAQFGLEVAKAQGAGQKVDKDTQKGIAEVEERSKAIKSAVARIQDSITKHGTFEKWNGEVEPNMERDLNSIAVDMAKLRDKDSAAREGEVAMERKGLPDPGLFKRDSSAQKTLQEVLKTVEERRQEAYRVRGLQPPGAPMSSSSRPAGWSVR